MLLNVYETRPEVVPGTRRLEADFGIQGQRLRDLYNDERYWEVGESYLPFYGRALGGIRTKLTDQKGFVTFCNQRDFEVLLGMARPGDWCRWAGEEYVAPGHTKWMGLCCDEADIEDVLFGTEMTLRQYSPYNGWLVPPMDVEFRVHVETGYDVEETHVLIIDHDPETGLGPDTQFETLYRRWARSERRRIQWNRV